MSGGDSVPLYSYIFWISPTKIVIYEKKATEKEISCYVLSVWSDI
jgi:hypothetical protein